MEWLSALLGPYPDVPPAALAVPVLMAILWAVNSNPKERERKGWHPVTKGLVGVFAILLVVAFVV